MFYIHGPHDDVQNFQEEKNAFIFSAFIKCPIWFLDEQNNLYSQSYIEKIVEHEI